MKYKNFSEVPSTSVVGAYKDLGTKLENGTIQFEELTAYLKAQKSVRKQIAKLLGVDIPETIQSKLESFGTLARVKNIPLNYSTPTGTDPDIEKWLPDATVSTLSIPQGKWKAVDTKNGTSEKVMLQTAKKMYLSQAIDTFTTMLEAGTFDIKGTCRIIFLEETDKEGNALKLVCVRGTGGGLSLCVRRVSPGDVWDGALSGWFGQQ